MHHRTVTASCLVLLAAGCGAASGDCDLSLTCPSYANVGATAEDTGKKPAETAACQVRPSEKGWTPDPKCGVFAAPSATSGGDGTLAAPFSSLQAAIDAADAAGKVVYACADVFAETIRVPSGAAVYGGLDCAAGWTYTPDKRTLVAPGAAAGPSGSEIAARLSAGEGETVIEDVDVTAPAALAPGASSIAVLVEDTKAEITRCTLTAGDGGGAMPAAATADDPALGGDDGLPGYDICGATNENPGPPGPMKSCDLGISRGGDGGDGGPPPSEPGGDGSPGLPKSPLAPASGLGGAGQSTAACQPGGQGEPGLRGEPGDGGSGLGALSIDGLHGSEGELGSRGLPGQGGGGGGGAKGKSLVACPGQNTLARAGATGGAGGAGGCGGEGGQGGRAGGSSIAVASLTKKAVLLVEVALHVGAGGRGGDGAPGQNGGNGGFGQSGGQGANGTANGCHGGDGGAGGAGGPGGGGAGGHAIGVAYAGLAPKGDPMVQYAGGAPSPGKGGAPGAGAMPGSGVGAAGISGDLVSFGSP